MKVFYMKNFLSLMLLGSFAASSAFAGTADYVYTPIVEHGEREIDFKYGTGTPPAGEQQSVGSLGFGYGATEYWFTELYLKREVEGSSSDVTIAEWENKFQLLETGKYPVDMGLITEIEAPVSASGPWEVKVGPLLQTEFGKLQLNANALFERKFSSDNSGVQYATEFSYQWQIKYRMQTEFEFGAQGFGGLGEWDSWVGSKAEEGHSVGPAIFGKLPLENRQAVRYNAAWLVGTGATTPEHTFRMQLEYEF